MSELTSIKVPMPVRDRLAAAAAARGVTVRALLDQLSCQALDAVAMDEVAGQMNRLRASDPDGWEEYLHEGQEWELGTSDRPDA